MLRRLFLVSLPLVGMIVGLQPVEAYAEPWKAALTISGGISLGAYEAGLNWALVKTLKGLKSGDLKIPGVTVTPELVAVTGASAGGINALATAIQWCADDGNKDFPDSIEQNVHRDIWMGVGFDTLLPEGGGIKGYDASDAVLSRKGFDQPIGCMKCLLGLQVQNCECAPATFDEGCRIGFGLNLTLERPINVDMLGGVKIPAQSMKVPIEIFVEGGRLRFKPALELLVKDSNLRYINKLSLRVDHTGEVSFESIRRAILATSAFPVAFGRMTLDYCYYSDPIVPTDKAIDRVTADGCPVRVPRALTSEFVDGGVFDNIPLDLAIDLAGVAQDEKASEPARMKEALDVHYIYLDPDRRRTARRRQSSEQGSDIGQPKGGQKEKAYGLLQQTDFLHGAIRSGRTFELFQTLKENREYLKGKGNLLLSDRFHPITGAMLGAFGGFLDPNFRELDYLVGVYDAIVDIAAELPKSPADDAQLESNVKVLAHYLGLSTSPRSEFVFRRLYCEEFEGGRCERGSDETLPFLLDALIAASRRSPDASGKPPAASGVGERPALNDVSFKEFAEEIGARKWKDMNPLLVSSLNDPSAWYEPLALQVLERMRILELKTRRIHGEEEKKHGMAAEQQEAQREEQKDLARVVCAANYLGHGAFDAAKPGLRVSDTPLSSHPWLMWLAPYEMGVDLRNGGGYLAWSYRYRTPSPVDVELKLTPLAMPASGGKVSYYMSAEIGPRWHFSGFGFSSMGLSVGLQQDWQNNYDDRTAEIAGFNVGLLGDKLRLSGVARMHYGGDQRWALLLGFTDVQGFFDWVFR